MRALLTAYFTTLIAFLGVDFVWLLAMSEGFYRPILEDVFVDRFRPAPAIVFYWLTGRASPISRYVRVSRPTPGEPRR
jgi:uncharacterized membrane protein